MIWSTKAVFEIASGPFCSCCWLTVWGSFLAASAVIVDCCEGRRAGSTGGAEVGALLRATVTLALLEPNVEMIVLNSSKLSLPSPFLSER